MTDEAIYSHNQILRDHLTVACHSFPEKYFENVEIFLMISIATKNFIFHITVDQNHTK